MAKRQRTDYCVWRCGSTMSSATGTMLHSSDCPTIVGLPEGGEGWLRGLGHCGLAYGDNPHRLCGWCGAALTGRRVRWCSDACADAMGNNHSWSWCRSAALKRDGRRCTRCGRGGGNWRLLEGLLAAFGVRLDYGSVTPAGLEAWRWFCTTGGGLEVNHIHPVRGRHHEFSCLHHLEGLETVCHDCHLGITSIQRRNGWSAALPEDDPLVLIPA